MKATVVRSAECGTIKATLLRTLTNLINYIFKMFTVYLILRKPKLEHSKN